MSNYDAVHLKLIKTISRQLQLRKVFKVSKVSVTVEFSASHVQTPSPNLPAFQTLECLAEAAPLSLSGGVQAPQPQSSLFHDLQTLQVKLQSWWVR